MFKSIKHETFTLSNFSFTIWSLNKETNSGKNDKTCVHNTFYVRKNEVIDLKMEKIEFFIGFDRGSWVGLALMDMNLTSGL